MTPDQENATTGRAPDQTPKQEITMTGELSTSVHKVSSNYKSTQAGRSPGPPVEPSTDPAADHQQPSLPWSPPETGPGQLGPAISSSERYYKAGLYAELQKFGRPKQDYQQMSLADAGIDWSPEDMDLLGITPTVEEDRALTAVQILLERTGYKGNLPPDRVTSAVFKWEGDLPNLAFTWAEYLEAYGLKRDAKGRLPRVQEDRAKAALISLAKPRRIIYKRTRLEKGQARHDVIACEKPLVELIEGYQGLTDQELAEVRAGRRPERASRLIIQPSPLLMDSLETFHLYKPSNLHQQIEDLVASKTGKRTRPLRSHSLFIQFLHTVDMAELKVSRDRLVDKLLLSKYREQRKTKQAYKQIDECLEIAQELGYILAYEEDAFGLITMQLNPEKLSRVKAKQERIAAWQERLQVPKKQTA